VSAHDLILSRIRERGPMTVAEFMELALYHPRHGYYATAAQRSGKRGDFFTSVDVGPLFGELVAVQLAEMWRLLQAAGAGQFDLVEAGAGNGRLARDILDAAAAEHADFYEHLRVTLVERSATARAAQADTLGPHAAHLAAATDTIPSNITGAIVANELLDALPVHVVTLTPSGLREIYVAERAGELIETEGDVSRAAESSVEVGSRRLDVEGGDVRIAIGARAEVGLAAVTWIDTAAAALDRGFLLIFDYGHPAAELYSATHAAGTLTAYRAHTADARHWLHAPGRCDLTAHVNLTAIQAAAERAGLDTLGIVDQTYFLMALGLADRLNGSADPGALGRRLAAKTLIMPGGLGSTIKVLLFSRRVGRPALRGLSSGRLT
jgi:SAM-dependent MidA family methyltransferase